MAGVRGFKDPSANNAQGQSTFAQEVDTTLSNKTTQLLPWYLNYLGGDWLKASQCMNAGSNGWSANHLALNGDLNDHWALKNTPWSWGHYRRSDLPTHFGIVEGFTVGDMYQDSVIASTNPNRMSWTSGSINIPGGPQTPDQGGELGPIRPHWRYSPIILSPANQIKGLILIITKVTAVRPVQTVQRSTAIQLSGSKRLRFTRRQM